MEVYMTLEDAQRLAASLSDAIEAAEQGMVVVVISEVFPRLRIESDGDTVSMEFLK
jgi:hypothetical protein